jgi:hypothetical protein
VAVAGFAYGAIALNMIMMAGAGRRRGGAHLAQQRCGRLSECIGWQRQYKPFIVRAVPAGSMGSDRWRQVNLHTSEMVCASQRLCASQRQRSGVCESAPELRIYRRIHGWDAEILFVPTNKQRRRLPPNKRSRPPPNKRRWPSFIPV